MAVNVKGNKNSASEDDLGLLHSLTTKLMIAKARNWNNLIESGADVDLVVDMKQLANIVKFIQLNGVVYADPAESEGNALKNQLDEIKKAQNMRLVSNGGVTFTDEWDD